MADEQTTEIPAEEAKGKTLLLEMSDSKEVKIELPPGARLTFGPNVPFAPKNTGGGIYSGDRGYALRVYEGKGNDTLIAVFANVVSFRDITMKVHKLVIRESGKSVWKSDEHGFEIKEEVKKDRRYVDLNTQLLTEGE